MIPMLLWRCPLCATDEALRHLVRPLRAERVVCRRCGAAWRVRRVPGDDFYLRVTTAGNAGGRIGDERPLAAWYDALKQTLHVRPLHDPAFAPSPAETLYLASGTVELQAEATDPLFFPATAAPVCADKSAVAGRSVGRGRLFLTERRLAWRGADGRAADFPLRRLNSAYAVMDIGVVLLVDLRLYMARFLEESLLKWVTYIGLIAPQVEAETGHRIVTSHF